MCHLLFLLTRALPWFKPYSLPRPPPEAAYVIGCMEQATQHLNLALCAQVYDNAPAVALYRGVMGYELESEEGEATARALQRPRRLLLGKVL